MMPPRRRAALVSLAGRVILASLVTLLVAQTSAFAVGRGDRPPGRAPRVRAPRACAGGHRCQSTDPIRLVWAGRTGDVVADSDAAGLWNDPDGYADATFELTFNVSGQLTYLYLSGAIGCYWSTDPGAFSWGIGVTRAPSMSLLNVGETRSIDLRVSAGDTLTLHIQEPHGLSCAQPANIFLYATVGGVDHQVTIAT